MSESELRHRLRERAGSCCEYCHLPELDDDLVAYHIDHIIALSHGGDDDMENLAWCCLECNWNKGTNLSGIIGGRIYPLFHPRRQSWNRHFQWKRFTLLAKTKTGGVTLYVLGINHLSRVDMRRELWQDGLFELDVG